MYTSSFLKRQIGFGQIWRSSPSVFLLYSLLLMVGGRLSLVIFIVHFHLDQVDHIVVGSVIQEVKTSNIAREVSSIPPSLHLSLSVFKCITCVQLITLVDLERGQPRRLINFILYLAQCYIYPLMGREISAHISLVVFFPTAHAACV